MRDLETSNWHSLLGNRFVSYSALCTRTTRGKPRSWQTPSSDQQAQVRTMLQLPGVVAQLLLKKSQGWRRSYGCKRLRGQQCSQRDPIRVGATQKLQDVAAGKGQGMQFMDDAICLISSYGLRQWKYMKATTKSPASSGDEADRFKADAPRLLPSKSCEGCTFVRKRPCAVTEAPRFQSV